MELSKPGNLRHQLGRMLAVDSDGCYIAVSAYEDRFALFPLSISAGSRIVDEKILYPPENEVETSSLRDAQRSNIRGTVWSMCFISKGTSPLYKDGYNPILAVIIHRKGAVLNDLFLFGRNQRKHSMHVISRFSEAGALALCISKVPHLPGFAILFRMGDLLLMDLRDPHNISCIHRINFSFSSASEELISAEESYRGLDVDDEGMSNVAACALLKLRDSGGNMIRGDDPMNIDSRSGKTIPSEKHVCSWSWEPCESMTSRLIFCLDSGELFIIEIHSDVEGIRVNSSDCHYRGLPCKALSWVKGGLIVGLVEMGDGMVLKLENGRVIYKSPIQNIAPILDLSVVDCHDEKQEIFASCGMNTEGSVRVIQSGISVEKLVSTAPIYHGITGTWTLKMKESDLYHSFLVLSFVEETRVLSVGVSFRDVSDATGFRSDACTLACGLVADGVLVQIHRTGVRLCFPTTLAHPDGIPLSDPMCTLWNPGNMAISLGAVSNDVIVVATSNPCYLLVLGIKQHSDFHFEIQEVQHLTLQHEVSCISIPRYTLSHEYTHPEVNMSNTNDTCSHNTIVVGKVFVIGTHKPSVEVYSFVCEEGFKLFAIGFISINNAIGGPTSGSIPENVRLVIVDKSYVLSGLRNGMLLRFEWPTVSAGPQNQLQHETSLNKSLTSSSVTPLYSPGGGTQNAEESLPILLQLIAIRRIGITPVFLVGLDDSLDADVLVLSDKPWLLHTARHGLAYTSIAFQPATHATPVCSVDCPKGIFFVSENSLHLVEMVYKRLNVQKFPVGGTPRKVLFHSDTKTLLILRTGLNGASGSSDICCMDPISGSILSTYTFGLGEIAKSMQMMKVGNVSVLIVGTSLSAGRTTMPSGEAESNAKGRLLVLSLDMGQSSSDNASLAVCPNFSSSFQAISTLSETVGNASERLSSNSLCSSPDDPNSDGAKMEETEPGQLRMVFQQSLSGAVLHVCPYLGRYVLASAGNTLNVFGFQNDNPHRVRKYAVSKTRFTINCLTTHFTRIVVGDCRDGIIFYSYQEDLRKLQPLYSDPVQRLVAACVLMDMDTAVVSDRIGSLAVLSCVHHAQGNGSPEKNLMQSCSFYMGETVMSIQKGLFFHKLPMDDLRGNCNTAEMVFESACDSIIASTLLGSVLILIPITSQEHELLEYVQARLAVHPLTSPILGNDHQEFRGRRTREGVPIILDGDMLAQFLELTNIEQEAVLATSSQLGTRASTSNSSGSNVTANQIVRLLERYHYVFHGRLL
ncbi:DNA damage-binding protein 1 isoform X2 [Dioscorea cayenensis subsp. rotundata]|uniref:DNA damage-binding protein 1 isoform X2 n=1 Tax=Dioscorea cayennensis subsp. rotundata TaxID=55577 RepID=A0AB40BXT0_DIOCR|nr:DNA damage-binding protein 1 isoform X2 [Dioscorea cayenensis subsp. rotundata]